MSKHQQLFSFFSFIWLFFEGKNWPLLRLSGSGWVISWSDERRASERRWQSAAPSISSYPPSPSVPPGSVWTSRLAKRLETNLAKLCLIFLRFVGWVRAPYPTMAAWLREPISVCFFELGGLPGGRTQRMLSGWACGAASPASCGLPTASTTAAPAQGLRRTLNLCKHFCSARGLRHLAWLFHMPLFLVLNKYKQTPLVFFFGSDSVTTRLVYSSMYNFFLK